MRNVRFFLGLVACLTLTMALVDAGSARAASDEVEASPKGTIGLGLVGAELGFIVPAVAGLDDTWAFVVFPLVGAGAGAAGGFYLLDDGNQVEFSIGVLALGIVAIIPTMVLTLSELAYDPGDEPTRIDDSVEGGGEGGGEAAPEDAPADAPAESRSTRRALARAGGLLRWSSDSGLGLGVPAFIVGSMARASPLDGSRGAEMRIGLLSATF